jgi:hypothetical protein
LRGQSNFTNGMFDNGEKRQVSALVMRSIIGDRRQKFSLCGWVIFNLQGGFLP